MCGRFSQSMTREDYLSYLADEADRDIAYDPEPIGQYNVSPGTKVLLLSERDEQLHIDPVFWGYALSSPTLSTVPMTNRYSWLQSGVHHLNVETKPKVF